MTHSLKTSDGRREKQLPLTLLVFPSQVFYSPAPSLDLDFFLNCCLNSSLFFAHFPFNAVTFLKSVEQFLTVSSEDIKGLERLVRLT